MLTLTNNKKQNVYHLSPKSMALKSGAFQIFVCVGVTWNCCEGKVVILELWVESEIPNILQGL